MDSDDDSSCKLTESLEKKAKKPSCMVINVLNSPRAAGFSARDVYEQIHAGDINLEPKYQRGGDVVWPETKQIMLIDSILRNFYIPPIIFGVKTHDDGSEVKTCIDGKQRLTSILRFMDGLIPYKEPITGECIWFKEGITGTTRGVERKIMPKENRKYFCNKTLVCVVYRDIAEEDERDVYQRAQFGVVSTAAEKPQVFSTPRAAFVREMVGKYLLEDGALGTDSLNWNTSSGSDFRCLGHAIYIMENSTPEECIMSNFSHVEKWLQATKPLDKSFKDNVVESLELFANLVSDSKHGKIFKKQEVSPVEFVYTAAFIFAQKDLSLSQLASGILEMFDHIRTIHGVVRMNNPVQKSFAVFISGWKSESGSADVRGSSVPGNKRKRTNMDVDEVDDDEDYAAPKAKKQAPEIEAEPVLAVRPAPKTDCSIAAIEESIAKIRAHENAAFASSRLEAGLPALVTSANPQMLPSPKEVSAPLPAVSAGQPPTAKARPEWVERQGSAAPSTSTSVKRSNRVFVDVPLSKRMRFTEVSGTEEKEFRRKQLEYLERSAFANEAAAAAARDTASDTRRIWEVLESSLQRLVKQEGWEGKEEE